MTSPLLDKRNWRCCGFSSLRMSAATVMIADLLDARALERDMLAATLDRLAVGIAS